MSQVFPARWIVILLITVGSVLAATSFGDIRLHIIIAALCGLVFITSSVAEMSRLQSNGASQHALAAASARSMGAVWLWGAIILVTSYTLLIPPWREWLHFFAAFAIVGILCMVFAHALNRDAKTGSGDQTLLKLGRILTILQLVGMAATLIGLAIDPDKSIILKKRPDWAANIVFVFGGLALLAISMYALWQQKTAAETGT